MALKSEKCQVCYTQDAYEDHVCTRPSCVRTRLRQLSATLRAMNEIVMHKHLREQLDRDLAGLDHGAT